VNHELSEPRLRITVTAEVPDEPGQEYTAVEMLLSLTNGLRVRGVTPRLLQLAITQPPVALGDAGLAE
jgi:hypothetical protein